MSGASSVIDIDLDDVDDNGVVELETLGSATDFTIGGALASGGVATMDYARQLVITSVGNDAGITFTVTGTDADGLALSEVVTGPNATTTETAGYFKTVTQIASSGATADDVSVGTVDEASSHTYPVNQVAANGTAIHVNVTGTINFTVQERFDDIQATGNPVQTNNWQSITALAAKTADTTSTASVGATALRILVNSHSSGGELQMHTVVGLSNV